MSIHWKTLNAEGKVAAIKAVYEPGMTSRDIASFFQGVTRNAIIGMYTRYPEELANCKLPGHGKWGKSLQKEVKQKAVSLAPRFFKTKERRRTPRLYDGVERVMCGRPIMALGANQCRWPVNDAEAGELHLFCSMPTEGGSYCDHHEMRAYRRPEC